MPKLKAPQDAVKLEPEHPEETETKTVADIKPDIESDKFSPDEQKEIVKIVQDDVDYGKVVQADYVKQKEKDLQHYQGAKPSDLEDLKKRPWMSDRNLGLARGIADSFQATYLATSWNPDSINFIATRTFDIDNRNNQEKFTKWGMGKQEANASPQIDAFIHNKIVVGSHFLKIYRKEWTEWVDKRIPVKNKKGNTYKWDIKTEKVKFQKGVIENIEDVDDILMPAFGKSIQELPFFIQILHLDGEAILDNIDRKVFKVSNKEDYKKKLYGHAYKDKERTLGEQRIKELKITETMMTDTDVRRIPVDIYEWYGYYTKNKRRERYRFYVDLVNQEFSGGKPLRKINRSGKIPYVGGRDISTMQIIAPIVNAFNNVYNQKSDFQYVTNCPFGFYNPDEGFTKQLYELEPLVCYPVNGDPTKAVYFPNLQRSMAWAESDIRILFEVLERVTGAATYFSIGQQRNKTLGQDLLVDKQSETRFGLGVSRLQGEICEAIGMWFELYQDFPPKGLAERVVGEDGTKIFPNLSIDSLRGDTAVQMTPDVVAGSKAYRKQLQLWAFQTGQQTFWLNPQVNPAGNWNLCADTFKELLNLSDNEVIRYLGEKPKAKFDETELNNEWYRFMNGEDFDPPEGETMLAQQHLEGHVRQKEEKYHLLSEEYRPNFDAHIFKTTVNVMKFMKNVQQEQIAGMLAANLAVNQPQPPQPPPGQPGIPQPGTNAPGATVATPGAPVVAPGQPLEVANA